MLLYNNMCSYLICRFGRINPRLSPKTSDFLAGELTVRAVWRLLYIVDKKFIT